MIEVAQPPVQGALLLAFVLSVPVCVPVQIVGPPAQCTVLGRVLPLGWLANVCAETGHDGRCAAEIPPGSIVGVWEP